MKLKIPQQDGLQKFFTLLQFVIFAVLLVALARVLFLLTSSWILRIPGLIAVYMIVSLFVYCVMQPLCMHLEAWIRRKRK